MKVLIIEPTFTPHPTDPDQGPVLHEQGTTPEVDKDIARKLVDAGKALYVSKSEDPYKGQKTADAELVEAAVKAQRAAAKAAKQQAASGEAGGAGGAGGEG